VITPSGPYNFANAGFENSHYLTAGATIFRTSGFEFYSSHYYNNPSNYAHDRIGVGNYSNTGTSGPCITCHMKPGNHTFLPVKKSSNDKLTAIATELTSTICANCHGTMSAEVINHEREQFHAAMEALNSLIKDKLFIYFATVNPYFFTKPYVTGYVEAGSCSENLAVRNWQTGGTTTFTFVPATKTCRPATAASGTSGTGDNNMGAAFNYNLLHHDYGAFAHNRYYAKRLIYDSISWLFDNDVKTTTNTAGYYSDVEAAIQSSASLTAEQKDTACAYLFRNSALGYTVYVSKNFRNWRPGSDIDNPVY